MGLYLVAKLCLTECQTWVSGGNIIANPTRHNTRYTPVTVLEIISSCQIHYHVLIHTRYAIHYLLTGCFYKPQCFSIFNLLKSPERPQVGWAKWRTEMLENVGWLPRVHFNKYSILNYHVIIIGLCTHPVTRVIYFPHPDSQDENYTSQERYPLHSLCMKYR